MRDRGLRLEKAAEVTGGCGDPLGHEELCDRALRAHGDVMAFADIEYRAYLDALDAPHEGGGPAVGTSESRVGGIAAKPSVLSALLWRVPSVAGLVLVLSGFAARSYGGRPYVGGGLVTAGLLVAAIAVGAAVGDLIWVSVMAARGRAEGEPEAPADVNKARPVWELALPERGAVSFLPGRLEGPRTGERGDRVAH
ncbi:hypothetical protein [Streptomyces sp. NPDC091217]|uniref:hypothetical protein n=1 Tax=Streptomyces sp. NPDC091217 TaxID=3365975 RepID=UPI0038136680